MLFVFLFIFLFFNNLESVDINYCENGYYLNKKQNKCFECNVECPKCENEADNCISCKPGEYLGKKFSNLYRKTRTCSTKCDYEIKSIKEKLYYLCVQPCSIGFFLKQEDGECKHCHENCATCLGPLETDCTSCKANEFQISGKMNDYNKPFKCSAVCTNPSSPIEGKKYKFCNISSNLKNLEQTRFINLFKIDWLHFLCFIFIISLLVIAIIFLIFKVRKSKRVISNYYTQLELLRRETEKVENIQMIQRNQIQLGATIGRGAFGEVLKCTFTDSNGSSIAAAVKIISPTLRGLNIEKERQRVFKELTSMMLPRHAYVTHLLGINMAQDLMLIMPLLQNSLNNFLKSPQTFIPEDRLARYCMQVAEGMMHLHKHQVLHCDLKAANILVNNDFHVQISDFGLACPSIDDKGKYRGGTLTHTSVELLTSMCAIFYTKQCDVWSYGVTVWEIFNKCLLPPYQGKKQTELCSFLYEGGRLEKPSAMDAKFWPIILQCFAKDPTTRPSFTELYNKFNQYAVSPNVETLSSITRAF